MQNARENKMQKQIETQDETIKGLNRTVEVSGKLAEIAKKTIVDLSDRIEEMKSQQPTPGMMRDGGGITWRRNG